MKVGRIFIFPMWTFFRYTPRAPLLHREWQVECNRKNYKVRIRRGFKLTININMFVKSSFIFCRFENLGLKNGSLILYIGGNTNGKDGISLMKACPTWYIFIIYIDSMLKADEL